VKEDSHNGTYRTNIGSEHYGCIEEKHSTSEARSQMRIQETWSKQEKHLTSKVRSQNNRSNGSRRVLTGIGTYLKLRKIRQPLYPTGKVNRAVGNHWNFTVID
jgi:hypothetical protein